MPLVSPAGALIAMKGSRAAEEVAQAEEALAEFGCAAPEILTLGAGAPAELDPATTVVRVVWHHPGVRG
jgi:16S rRNA (guanine527-N7)-methyltransferase